MEPQHFVNATIKAMSYMFFNNVVSTKTNNVFETTTWTNS